MTPPGRRRPDRLPVIGIALFGWLACVLTTAHNIAGLPCAVSLVVVLSAFAKDNLPSKEDFAWLRKACRTNTSRPTPGRTS